MFSRSRAVCAPIRRTKDPLLSSSVAQHFILPSGNQFIIRPPPSVLPPTVPISQTSTNSTHPFLESIVASPLKTPSTSSEPSSSSPIDPSALPSSRSRRSTPPVTSTKLSPEQINQIQQLRLTSSSTTRSQLSKQFGISPQVVGRIGYGKSSEARLVEKVKKGSLELEREEREAGWGWKKSIAREERRRRREMW